MGALGWGGITIYRDMGTLGWGDVTTYRDMGALGWGDLAIYHDILWYVTIYRDISQYMAMRRDISRCIAICRDTAPPPAEGGADPALNPGLAAVVAQCRTLNVPKATIEGALRSVRGHSALTAARSLRPQERPAGGSQVLLTARGPGGSLVLLDVRTDNVRRSQAELRTLLGRHGSVLTAE
ncbi:probable transcriptional regulatory protein BH14810 isoform X1 [Pyrgilauda ruficollis]|uniref:probable transcriptional regulatory protein BH14810 isoform X1 n=1 Tax=Pyrgilauda ruficollis TaxID=221976 RepID=UPI001B86E0C5|nr:probable transcriptional regulatory protein BH14810 isoform X1 [Pyrgilauda ruficollis]